MNKQQLRESRGARVMRNAKAAKARRRECAATFRARLLAEVKGEGVAREALVETAVSLHVQITELSRRFLQCRASDEAMTRLQIARGQFLRCLRALGLAGASANLQDANAPPQGASAEEKREWSRKYVDGVLAEAAK